MSARTAQHGVWIMISYAACFLYFGACADATAGEPARLRVITYNVHHGEGRDQKVDVDRIAAIIRETRADVVCLQEVDRNLPRTGKADFPTLLARKLEMTVVFEPNYQFDGGDYGNATLTRFPVAAHENIHLPGPAGAEPRGCLRTTIQVGARTVDVLNTHFGLDAKERKQQAGAVLNAVRDVPTILAGDLNESRGQPAVESLLLRFRDAAEPGAEGAKRRIDFILVSGPVDVLSSRLVATPETAVASDHLPYTADVAVRAPKDKAAREGVMDNNDERVTEAIVEGT